MEFVTIQWKKCQNNFSWCRFDSNILNNSRLTIDLGPSRPGSKIDISGIYVIFAGVHNPKILKVGSGKIKQRFREHLKDPEVLQYYAQGLYATWATLPLPSPNPFKPTYTDRIRGAEKYLSIVLAPVLLGERFPKKVEMVAVNPPVWEDPVNQYLRAGRNRGSYLSANRTPVQFRKKQTNPFL